MVGEAKEAIFIEMTSEDTIANFFIQIIRSFQSISL